jgi:ubiquinone/menaquinone biosynthesis C-methylase UbiE
MLSVARRPVGVLGTICARCSGNARTRIVPEARGVVIEPGIGRGRNMPFYDRSRVTVVHGVDPDEAKLGRAKAAAGGGLAFEPHRAVAEALPFADASADTVVMSYTFCALDNPALALAEVRRVLKPGGRLLFCEHGRSHDRTVARMQDRLDPLWVKFGGGCHLNRDVAAILGENGFRIAWLDTFYANRALPALTFHYAGAAVPL